MSFLNKVFDGNKRELKKINKIADKVIELDNEVSQLSDQDILGRLHKANPTKFSAYTLTPNLAFTSPPISSIFVFALLSIKLSSLIIKFVAKLFVNKKSRSENITPTLKELNLFI
jgi:hypothetical protein